MSNPAPGFAKRPDHTLTFERCRARASVGETVIANSEAAVLLREGSYPPVIYFPPESLATDHFLKTDHSTYCPFKGHASYWTLQGLPAAQSLESAVWAYETPYDECEQIKNHAAFYSDRVHVEPLDDAQPSQETK